MTYELKILEKDTSVDETISLCAEAGIADMYGFKRMMLGFIANSWSPKPDIEKGIVYGVYDGADLLAAARIRQDDYIYDAASIEFVAVKKEHRGKGIGKILITSLLGVIKQEHGKTLAILATGDEAKFYEKCGMTEMLVFPKPGSDIKRYYMHKHL